MTKTKRSRPSKTQITIYAGRELKAALEKLADEMDRDLSSQCVAMLKASVGNIDTAEKTLVRPLNA